MLTHKTLACEVDCIQFTITQLPSVSVSSYELPTSVEAP
jgi:hypothetical protein